MDSGGQSQPYDEGTPFSLAARTPIGKRKRPSVVRPPTPSPMCQERVHYPIFNPQNPRHNPSAGSARWNASDDPIDQSASPRNSVRWMQGLPGRSLRKARSGLLALRSGMQRNNQQPDSAARGSDIPCIWSSSDSSEGAFSRPDYFPSTISEASTECDGEFGTGIYRTKCNCSSALVNEPGRYMLCSSRGSPSRHGCLPEVDEDSSPGTSADDQNAMSPRLSADTCKQHGTQWGSGFDSVPSASESSNSPPSSNSSSNSIAPRLGVSLSTEPLRMFDRSRTASSMSGAKSSRSPLPEPPADVPEEASMEPADMIDRAFTRAVSEETLNSHMDGGDSLAENGSSYHGLPSPRYPFDFMEAWVSEVASSQRQNDNDDAIFSAGPSSHSNTHSEGGTNTEPTSMSMSLSRSNNHRSSIDEELLTLPSPRDEYFLLDGKHSYFRPDGADNAVKADSGRMMTSDESGAQSSSLSRNPSDRFPPIQQVLGPGGPPQRRMVVREGERLRVDGSDSTDSHFATYSLWQRRDGRFG